jgi:hypothetical protein
MALVYLLGDSGQDGIFKIGVTKGEIENRIKQLQTGNGSEIYLVNFYETQYPFFMERALHARFNPQKKKNEWFILSAQDVIDFKKTCMKIEENAKALKNNPFAKKMLK